MASPLCRTGAANCRRAPRRMHVGPRRGKECTEHFLPAVHREVAKRVQAVSREGLLIKACSLGNGAGRLGAARMAIDRLTNFLSATTER